MNYNGGFHPTYQPPFLTTHSNIPTYVKTLDQNFLNVELNESAILQSDFAPYDPKTLAQNTKTFLDGNFDSRIRYLVELRKQLPYIGYQKYDPSSDYWDTHTFVRKEITAAVDAIDVINKYPNSFLNLIHTLEFWAERYRYLDDNTSNNNISKASYLKVILTQPRFILDLLCRMMLPPALYDIISKTELALAFALLTGRVIEGIYDPTANRESWNIVSSLPMRNINTLQFLYFKLEDNLPNMWHPNKFGSMLFISDPRIMVLIPYIKAEEEHKFMSGIIPVLSPELKVRFPNKEAFLTSVGFNPIYYPNATKDLQIRTSDVAGYIIHKDLGVPRPPLLYSVPTFDLEHKMREVLMWYNDDEIINFYLPHLHESRRRGQRYYRFFDRSAMSVEISGSYTEVQFSWVIDTEKVNCMNGENVSLMYGGKRSEDINESTGEELKENPILTYGTLRRNGKYRCFRVSELLNIFENTLEDPNGPDFPDPDYINPGPGRPHVIDPLTNRRLLRTFNALQMSKLRTSLNNATFQERLTNNDQPSLTLQLLNLVNRIYRVRYPGENQTLSLDEIAREIDVHQAWRNDLLLFFSWLFMFSMWMRFWKGPGYAFNIGEVTTSRDKCLPIQRDEHIIIELSVYSNMLFDLENHNKELAVFVKNLPLLHYEWNRRNAGQNAGQNDRDVASTGTPIVTVIDLIQNENYCMGFGGEVLLGTAYYYLVKLLKIPEDRMRDFITYSIQLMRRREGNAIQNRKNALENTKLTDAEHRLWVQQGLLTIQSHELLLHIGEPGAAGRSGYEIPSINFSKVAYNMHV